MAVPPQVHLEGLHRAERALLDHLERTQDRIRPGAPSRLAGWSLGHVITHAARNADSMVTGLEGAARGQVVPRYPGGAAQRDGDIERGATRPLREQIADLRSAYDRLARAWEAAAGRSWTGACTGPLGPQAISELPLLRWREVEVHHSDLGLDGFTLDDWSTEFVEADLAGIDQPFPAPIAARSPHRRLAWFHGRHPVGEPSWDAATLDPGWCRRWTDDEIGVLVDALARFEARQPDLDPAKLAAGGCPPGDFGLHDLDAVIEDLRARLVTGQGVAAFEGFPVGDFSNDQLRALWWGLSCAVGTPVVQSRRGDLIGDVRDLGTGINGPRGRGYTSNAELNFHADACDVSCLFFLRTAAEGGVTRLASSTATHDQIARGRPDLLASLYEPMPCSWQGNQPVGEPGWYDMPVFGNRGAEVSCAYVRTNILRAAENTGAPPLRPEQIEAVEAVVSTASTPGMWVERRFEPGAMLFTHSHTTFHLRTAFIDHPEPERKRHLLRTWLSLPDDRALPQSFGAFFADVRPGAVRGGYPPPPDGARVYRTAE